MDFNFFTLKLFHFKIILFYFSIHSVCYSFIPSFTYSFQLYIAVVLCFGLKATVKTSHGKTLPSCCTIDQLKDIVIFIMFFNLNLYIF